MSDRAANVAEAQRLRAEGLLLREIAERMGCALQTVHAYISDPDLAKLKARKDGYRGTCVDCGAKTDGSNGSARAPDRCLTCTGRHTRQMSRRWIIESFQEWEEMFGAPPSATDWNRALAIKNGQHYKAERYDGTGRPWPSSSLVQDIFGSWNAGRAAAGYDVFEPSSCGRDGDDPIIVAETVRLYRSGLSLAQVGEIMGVSGSAVRERLVTAREPRRPAGRNNTARVIALPRPTTAARKAAA